VVKFVLNVNGKFKVNNYFYVSTLIITLRFVFNISFQALISRTVVKFKIKLLG